MNYDNPMTRTLCQCCRVVVIEDAGDRDIYCSRCINLAKLPPSQWPDEFADRLDAVREDLLFTGEIESDY